MGRSQNQPLVAVVTPVHNGAEHLEACIESVLAQEYENWRHVVVDNASTDGTISIARRFAELDERIEVRCETEFVPLLTNWNRALAHLPADAVYIKHLSADDCLRPACLRALVEAAESHPGVGIVTSGFFNWRGAGPAGAPSHLTVLPGMQVARETLTRGVNWLAQPSVLLLRREAAPSFPNLYPVEGFPPGHAAVPAPAPGDKAGYLDTLERWDVAFVPEVLSDLSRRDRGAAGRARRPRSATGWSQRVAAWHPGRLDLLLDQGERFLGQAEAASAIRSTTLLYLRAMGWRLLRLQGREPEFAHFQRLCLDHLVPRLRGAGYALEARLLAPLAGVFRRLDRPTAA
jgi:hypothetical protein